MEHMDESMDHIMKDFRSNGKDVDYVELDLDAIELDRYAPDARSLIIGLLHDTGLDADMKIIRPPSKTPPHLPTSTINLMKKQVAAGQLVHGGCSPWNLNHPRQLELPFHGGTASPAMAPYVFELTQSMCQMALSDRAANFFIPTSPIHAVSRPIFGTGATMKPSFEGMGQPRYWKWDSGAVDPGRVSSHHVAMLPGTPVKSLETPVVAVAVNSPEILNEGGLFLKGMSRGCSENEGSSDEDISEDSGNFTGGDLSPSLGSDLSPSSSAGADHDSPSYASVLNSSATNLKDGEPMQAYTEVSLETPKSHLPEGLRGHLWNQKKFRRLSDAASSEDSHRIKECVFCKTNGETPSLYRGHVLKDEKGRTVCHVLQKYVCPLCGATGENAHTVKYCPKNSNPPAVSMMTTLKSMRSATGNVRMMSNLRRTRSTSRRQQKRSPPSSFAVA